MITRHVNEPGLNLIKRWEKFVDHVYICPAGWPTVGYGHIVKKGETFGTITEAQAAEILKVDLIVAERAVLKYIKVPLTDGQFDALVSFTFNCGAGALQRSTLRSKVNREEHSEVPDEFMKWVRGGGRILNGLVKRRAAEALLYQS